MFLSNCSALGSAFPGASGCSAGGNDHRRELTRALGSGRFRFRHMGSDRIHQRRRQTIIGLKPKLTKARPDPVHLRGGNAGFDHRRYECRKSRSCPAAFGEKFGMDEVETIERMPLVLDAAVHMRPAILAGVALDRRRRVDNLQLVAVFENRHAVARDNSDDRKGGALRLPAFGAAAGMIVGDIALDANLYRPVLALTDKRAAGKATRSFLYSVVN